MYVRARARARVFPVSVTLTCALSRFQVQKVDFGLIVCDEGHRLKNSSIKTSSALSSLSCSRRVILTGAWLKMLKNPSNTTAPPGFLISTVWDF